MSDGENAAPGPRGQAGSSSPNGSGDDNQWLTRSRRRSPGAAPWERTPQPSRDDTDTPEPTGSHSEGVTVADLIAKLSGDHAVPPSLRRRRAQPSPPKPAPPPSSPPTEVIEPVPADPEPGLDEAAADPDEPDTVVLPAAVVPSELPDLTRRRGTDRVSPTRIGSRTRTDHRPPTKGHRKTMAAGRVVAALLAVLALASTGGAWQWQSAKNNMLNRIAALDPDSRDIVDPNAQFGDENFLIVGVDSRFGENQQLGVGTTEDAAGSRSDTVMLVNIPASRERVVAVSFPRDLEIEPMKCEPWNPVTGEYGPLFDEETQSYGPDEVYTEYKLNSAYAVGGPKCLVKVIQKLSGLSVNRFMAVDFAGFSKMVDALGGVEVCTTEPLVDYELGTVLPRAGRQIVDGHTALNYVRARQVTTEVNGDYGRIKRQQLFLSSLLRSLISKEVFFSLSKLNNVVNMFIDDSYVDNMDTKDLVTLGQSVQGIAAGRITFLTVPTTGYMDEYGNEQLRVEDNKALFNAIINDLPLPEEKNADNTPVPGTPESSVSEAPTHDSADSAPSAELVNAVTTNPQDITVQVSNSTSQDGLGAATAQQLQAHGFNVTTPDDYPGPLEHTTVFFSPGNEEAAATVASAFGNPTVERVTGLGDVVQVVLGTDFYSVSPPSPSGSPVQVHVVRGTRSAAAAQLPEDLTVVNAADTACE